MGGSCLSQLSVSHDSEVFLDEPHLLLSEADQRIFFNDPVQPYDRLGTTLANMRRECIVLQRAVTNLRYRI